MGAINSSSTSLSAIDRSSLYQAAYVIGDEYSPDGANFIKKDQDKVRDEDIRELTHREYGTRALPGADLMLSQVRAATEALTAPEGTTITRLDRTKNPLERTRPETVTITDDASRRHVVGEALEDARSITRALPNLDSSKAMPGAGAQHIDELKTAVDGMRDLNDDLKAAEKKLSDGGLDGVRGDLDALRTAVERDHGKITQLRSDTLKALELEDAPDATRPPGAPGPGLDGGTVAAWALGGVAALAIGALAVGGVGAAKHAGRVIGAINR